MDQPARNPTGGLMNELDTKTRHSALTIQASDPFQIQKWQHPRSLDEGTDVEIAEAVLEDLAQKYGLNIIKTEGRFYAYRGTHWCALHEDELRNAIYRYDRTKCSGKHIVKLTAGKAASILSIMGDRAESREFFSDAPKGINCKSGFIDFDESCLPILKAHSPQHRQRHCLPAEWNPEQSWRQAPLLSKFLTGCFGEDPDGDEKIALMAEACGIAALGGATALPSQKAIVLLGVSAANGKSEMLSMMAGLLPEDAVCAIPPERLNDERMLIQLAGCLLNVCSELGTTRAVAGEAFKAAITGDRVMAKEIYHRAAFFRPHALHVFSTNTLPPFQGGLDRGVERRLLVVLFNRTIPENDRVANIGTRIAIEEADALLAYAVEGASRILQTKRFTTPPSSREALREWAFQADPVLAWKERRTEYSVSEHTPVAEAYADFLKWAEEEGIEKSKLPAVNNFVVRLRSHEGRFAKGTHNKVRMIRGLKLKPGEDA